MSVDLRRMVTAGCLHGSRRDDYRVLYEVDDTRVVRIMRVRHHREAYR
jgi:mRNA-degrading endonuclease RelE of RelBE toxin-antitoxin system